MSREVSSHRVLLLGRDHPDFGRHETVPVGQGSSVCAISAGSDPFSPAMRSKGDENQPNEDALLIVDPGDRLMVAVADAHFGLGASHRLLEELARLDPLPDDLTGLEEALETLEWTSPTDRSATTLVVAILDRHRHAGFGVSHGDSSLVLVGPGGARRVNTRDTEFLSSADPGALRSGQGRPFHFRARPGQLLVAHTDGLNECHYRSPETSVRLAHMEELYEELGPDPATFAERLMEMALEGVGGNPGGQDNVALVVSRTGAR